jgi:hypothetical protein
LESQRATSHLFDDVNQGGRKKYICTNVIARAESTSSYSNKTHVPEGQKVDALMWKSAIFATWPITLINFRFGLKTMELLDIIFHLQTNNEGAGIDSQCRKRVIIKLCSTES